MFRSIVTLSGCRQEPLVAPCRCRGSMRGVHARLGSIYIDNFFKNKVWDGLRRLEVLFALSPQLTSVDISWHQLTSVDISWPLSSFVIHLSSMSLHDTCQLVKWRLSHLSQSDISRSCIESWIAARTRQRLRPELQAWNPWHFEFMRFKRVKMRVESKLIHLVFVRFCRSISL